MRRAVVTASAIMVLAAALGGATLGGATLGGATLGGGGGIGSHAQGLTRIRKRLRALLAAAEGAC